MYIPNNWMWQGKFSVGQSSYKKEALTERWLMELPVSIEEIQACAPVKCKWLWINNALYDFHTKYHSPGLQPELNWVRYHGFCVIIVLMGKRLGADMSMEIREIRNSLNRQSFLFKFRVIFDVFRRLCQTVAQLLKSYFQAT